MRHRILGMITSLMLYIVLTLWAKWDRRLTLSYLLYRSFWSFRWSWLLKSLSVVTISVMGILSTELGVRILLIHVEINVL